MPDNILSIAVMEPFDGLESEFLAVLRDLYRLMERKGYSRDDLLRKPANPPQYINIRHWASAQARHDAHEDPDVHHCWARLGNLCNMIRVHETLEPVNWRGHCD